MCLWTLLHAVLLLTRPYVLSCPLAPAGTYDLRICCNGVLSGLVIVTCMCGFVDPWAAVVCSAIAGALYAAGSWLLLRCGIDDPLDSSAVHLGSGALGSIMVAFVANPKHVYALTGSPCGGIFYARSGWLQLGLQLLALVVVIVFAGGMAWVLFWCLAKRGLLRVDQTTELAGIDNMEHGGEECIKDGPQTTSNEISLKRWHLNCMMNKPHKTKQGHAFPQQALVQLIILSCGSM